MSKQYFTHEREQILTEVKGNGYFDESFCSGFIYNKRIIYFKIYRGMFEDNSTVLKHAELVKSLNNISIEKLYNSYLSRASLLDYGDLLKYITKRDNNIISSGMEGVVIHYTLKRLIDYKRYNEILEIIQLMEKHSYDNKLYSVMLSGAIFDTWEKSTDEKTEDLRIKILYQDNLHEIDWYKILHQAWNVQNSITIKSLYNTLPQEEFLNLLTELSHGVNLILEYNELLHDQKYFLAWLVFKYLNIGSKEPFNLICYISLLNLDDEIPLNFEEIIFSFDSPALKSVEITNTGIEQVD